MYAGTMARSDRGRKGMLGADIRICYPKSPNMDSER